jgi:hypothetical protein
VADAKANPGKLNYGSWSVGNPVHLGSALFESTTGTQMAHVIYKETTQLYTGVATASWTFALGTRAAPGLLQRAGKLRYLAVAAPQRHPAYPECADRRRIGRPGRLRGERLDHDCRARGPAARRGRQDHARHREGLAEPDVKEKFEPSATSPSPPRASSSASSCRPNRCAMPR